MSDFYTEMQVTAAGILDEFKQGEVILTRIANAPSDPETPWIPGAPTPTDYELKATVRGVSKDQIDGTLILSSDEVVTSSADIIEPILADTLTVDGNPRAIKMIKKLPSAGVAVAYAIFIAG